MQNLTNFPSLIDRWLRYKFQTILVGCFLLWTPLLVIETLQIQHSCHPMIHWSGTLPAECQPKLLQFNSTSSKKPETRRDRSQEQKQIAKSNPRSPLPKPSPTPQRQTPFTLATLGLWCLWFIGGLVLSARSRRTIASTGFSPREILNLTF
ncbi:MAG: hypothetical protein V7K57_28890 [Nostoc sp.]|uniref:hypothetical protein n=1 Tax=Nostoc sp. TaxID=1180 RepID=UPI002FF8A44D